MKASHKVTPVFDDPNLVGSAGLVPAMLLAQSAGLHHLATEHLEVTSPNAAAKTTGIVAGMVAGADSIDDLDVLRHGAMPRLFAGLRAPSTLGTYLRTFTQGQIAQLDAVASRSWPRSRAWSPGCWPGPPTVTGRGSRSSMSTTPSARSTATPSRAPPTATPA